MEKLASIYFGEWLPDQGEYENPGSPYASNVLWVDGCYQEAGEFTTLGAALSARAQGAYSAADANGDVHIYVGTATQLLEYSGTGFTDVSGGTTFTTGDGQYWKMTEFSSSGNPTLVIATNYADSPQSISAGVGAFAALAGTPPKASAIGAINQFVMLGNTIEATNGQCPSRVQWCGIAAPTNWAFGTLAAQQAQAGEQFLNAVYGPVTHISDGYAYGLIFQQRAITRAYYTGGDAIFNFDTYEKQRGAYYPNSPVQIGNSVYFIAEDGFCSTDGQQVNLIGHGKVDAAFLSDVNQGYADRVCGSYDPVSKLIRWCYCSAGNSTGIPDKTIAYNYAEDKFSPTTQDLSRVFTSRSFGYTMDTLDNVNTDLDSITPSLDDPAWQGGNLQVQAFDSSNNYGTLNGAALDALIDTLEARPNPEGVVYIDGVRPVITDSGGDGVITVIPMTRALENQAYTIGSSASQNQTTGICNMRVVGGLVRMRVGITGGFDKAKAVDVFGRAAGRR